jgi:hypothetical protein
MTPDWNVPSKCHCPVKLLNGPPTIWLFQSMENAPVAGVKVPVGAAVPPGVVPSGLGAPWLKCCVCQAAANARRSPPSFAPSAVIRGGATFVPVWGSFEFVAVEKRVP